MSTMVIFCCAPDGNGYSKEVRLKTAQEYAHIALRNAERATRFGSIDVLRAECEEWRADGARMGDGEHAKRWHAQTAYSHAWKAVIAARHSRAGRWSYDEENAAWRAALWAAKCAGYEEAAA